MDGNYHDFGDARDPRDDFGDGYRDDWQRAFAVSRMRESLVDLEIQTVLNQGMFAIVCHSTAYCSITDGILGERKTLEASFEWKKDAEDYLETLQGEDDIYFKLHFDVDKVNQRLRTPIGT